MSVAEAQRRIDSREFAEWMAFYRVEPFGEARADMRWALDHAMTFNIHRSRNAEAMTPEKAMRMLPGFDSGRGRPKTAGQIEAMMMDWVKRSGAAKEG